MRLTVGPLPPAVYWRRRAVVLGVVLLFLLVVVYSFSGPDKSGAAGPESTKSPQVAETSTSLTPTSESPTGEPSHAVPTSAASAGASASALPADGTCTDAEMLVTPVPSRTSAKRGVTIELKLRIKNISNRTCNRDVGADAQELYITLGAQKIWSSDTCGTGKGSNVQPFRPSLEHEYAVAWNGNSSTSCENGVATGTPPDAGEYQIFGRLGTKYSDPVKITITN